ncbi:MAG: hypothetical protein ACI4OH_05250 [Mitsuokella sp.]|uniref:hypothetical protein n=1 Tax=Mitsuokella sp. TaxID=2049034 RepID=UPI003EFD527C
MELYIAQSLWNHDEPELESERILVELNCRHNLSAPVTFSHSFLSLYAMTQSRLFLLGRCLQDMAHADAVIFNHGWQRQRDCVYLYEMATRFTKPIYFVDDFIFLYDEKTQQFKPNPYLEDLSRVHAVEISKHFYPGGHETNVMIGYQVISQNADHPDIRPEMQRALPKATKQEIQAFTEKLEELKTDKDFQAILSLLQTMAREGESA